MEIGEAANNLKQARADYSKALNDLRGAIKTLGEIEKQAEREEKANFRTEATGRNPTSASIDHFPKIVSDLYDSRSRLIGALSLFTKHGLRIDLSPPT